MPPRLRRVRSVLPGTVPGAPRRNVLVIIGYLLVTGFLFGLAVRIV